MIDYNCQNRFVPKVSFDSKELEAYMFDFVCKNMGDSMSVRGYLGLVMIRLGFDVDDKIELCNFNRDKKEDYFLCKVNNMECYDIKFENISDRKRHTKITLVNNNIAITYECFPLKVSELGVRIVPVMECVEYENGSSYIREYSREDVKIKIISGNYRFELEVVKPKELELPLYDRDGLFSRYRLDNEDVLRDILLGYFLKWNVKDIISMYKDICEISLGSDMYKYGELYLKYINNGEITDIIHLKKGELENFGMTLPEMGRALFLNKDGSWSYKMNDRNDLFSYSMDVIGDMTNYNIMVREGVDISLVSEVVQTDSIDVKENIENVKKLTKNIFNNK